MNRVSVELGQNITYADLEKGDIVTFGDNAYIVSHVGNLKFQLINIATGHNRYDCPCDLDELTKTIKEENGYRKIRFFKNSTMQLKLGKEYIPYT